jgi:hypothetical protein
VTPQEEKKKLSSKLGLMNVCWEKKMNEKKKKKKKKRKERKKGGMNKPSEYVNGRKEEY